MRFYSHVLSTGEDPLWREDLMNNLGMPIIGLGARSEESAHLPLQWMAHIQVADVAASVNRALVLGGNELMHGRDDAGKSQWAVLVDPNGAAFGIIPVVSGEAASTTGDEQLPAAAGHISWISLTVSDASATRDFYRQVVDWSARDVEMEDDDGVYTDYDLFDVDGNPAAGISHARGVNVGLPPNWLIYIPVGDLAESLRRVQDGGGTIINSTRQSDGGYTDAVVQDPVGACLALVQG